MPKKLVIRRVGREAGIPHISKTFGLPETHLREIDKVCKAHNKRIEEIPAWLLKKNPRRVEYWFKTGK